MEKSRGRSNRRDKKKASLLRKTVNFRPGSGDVVHIEPPDEKAVAADLTGQSVEPATAYPNEQRAFPVVEAFAVKTRSKNPGCALLIDTGSPTNLMSDSFHRELEKTCKDYGIAEPKYRKRDKPLRVGGIGSGTQQADFDAKFSIGINQRIQDTAYPKFAEFAGPVLPNSDVPGIIGQSSLKQNRVILDCFNLRMYTIGPGEAIIELPPGSEMYDLEESRDGHLMLPCDMFPNHHEMSPPGAMKVFHASADTEVPMSSFE